MKCIDPDATLVRTKSQTSHVYITYECGCWEYVGDLDAPHEGACKKHEIELDEEEL